MKTKKLVYKNMKRAIITIVGILLLVIINFWTLLQGEIIRKTPTRTVEGVITPEGEVIIKLLIIAADICISLPILIGCVCLWSPPKSRIGKTILVVNMCLTLLIGAILWYWYWGIFLE